jgi:hypothetical protein
MSMHICDEIARAYTKMPSRRFVDDVAYCMEHGYVFLGPGYCLMGYQESGGWLILFAAGHGAFRRFFSLMPYYLPRIGWAREIRGKQTIMWHDTERLRKLCYAKQSGRYLDTRTCQAPQGATVVEGAGAGDLLPQESQTPRPHQVRAMPRGRRSVPPGRGSALAISQRS